MGRMSEPRERGGDPGWLSRAPGLRSSAPEPEGLFEERSLGPHPTSGQTAGDGALVFERVSSASRLAFMSHEVRELLVCGEACVGKSPPALGCYTISPEQVNQVCFYLHQVRPKLPLLKILQAAGAQGEMFTVKEVSRHGEVSAKRSRVIEASDCP
ncbi:Protein Mdm4 [Galemys pyrenaicus]|uniref:Protein Mdm4 n=1 Tax=Galemys pyrenaicus TaxID=202257 RepID=A0A8J6AXS0_GALPY|nr:Protein Mdm4 [Galemys pyrenaicus]